MAKEDIKKELNIYLKSKEFESKINKIVKDRIKDDKALEDKVVEITKNVITQLYKALWVKRGIWRSSLSNKSN